MSIVKKIVREGNSKVLNLGSDIADALGVTWDDELEIVVLNNIAVMRKRDTEWRSELVSEALERLDIEEGEYGDGLTPAQKKVLGVLEGSDSELSIKEISNLAGISYSYASKVLRRLVEEGLIESPRPIVQTYKRKG